MSDQEPDHREVMAARDAANQEAVKKGANRGCLLGAVAFFVLFGLCYAAGSSDDDDGGGPAGGEVTRARAAVEASGAEWPLTVEDGTIRCENGGQVTFEGGGRKYAVNGTARGQTDLPDIDPIWADTGDGLGLKKNIGPIIDIGLELCD